MKPTRSLHPLPRVATKSGAPRPKARGDEELARYAKALAHPARVAILRMLIARGECICGQIVEGMPLAQATVSQHLKVLKDSGLVQGEVDGPRVCYCVDPKVVKRFQELVQEL
jgi:ArsR family transcriptional regulator